MAKIYKCDICGKYEPRSIRRIIAENPEPDSSPLNKERYYCFNLFHGDFCDECLHEIERTISAKVDEMKTPTAETDSQSEQQILKNCIELMQELVIEFQEWYKWVYGEDAISQLDEEERFCIRRSYFRIVQKLFLMSTNHSGGTSTRMKCGELGVDCCEEIEFGFEVEE